MRLSQKSRPWVLKAFEGNEVEQRRGGMEMGISRDGGADSDRMLDNCGQQAKEGACEQDVLAPRANW